MKIVKLAALFLMLLLAGCCDKTLKYSGNLGSATKIQVNYSVAEMKLCDFNTARLSEITIDRASVPEHTHFLKLKVEDVSINLLHGLTVINYDETGTSDVIPLDFFRLQPFCPLLNPPHNYQLSVYALDKDHKVLGYGQIIKEFPQ